jgi:hypothetical protein
MMQVDVCDLLWKIWHCRNDLVINITNQMLQVIP